MPMWCCATGCGARSHTPVRNFNLRTLAAAFRNAHGCAPTDMGSSAPGGPPWTAWAIESQSAWPPTLLRFTRARVARRAFAGPRDYHAEQQARLEATHAASLLPSHPWSSGKAAGAAGQPLVTAVAGASSAGSTSDCSLAAMLQHFSGAMAAGAAAGGDGSEGLHHHHQQQQHLQQQRTAPGTGGGPAGGAVRVCSRQAAGKVAAKLQPCSKPWPPAAAAWLAWQQQPAAQALEASPPEQQQHQQRQRQQEQQHDQRQQLPPRLQRHVLMHVRRPVWQRVAMQDGARLRILRQAASSCQLPEPTYRTRHTNQTHTPLPMGLRRSRVRINADADVGGAAAAAAAAISSSPHQSCSVQPAMQVTEQQVHEADVLLLSSLALKSAQQSGQSHSKAGGLPLDASASQAPSRAEQLPGSFQAVVQSTGLRAESAAGLVSSVQGLLPAATTARPTTPHVLQVRPGATCDSRWLLWQC